LCPKLINPLTIQKIVYPGSVMAELKMVVDVEILLKTVTVIVGDITDRKTKGTILIISSNI